MNDLDRSSCFKCFLWSSAQRFGGKHDQQRAATFSTSSEHVLNDLIGLTSVEVSLQCFVDGLFDRIAPSFKRRWKLSHFREPSKSCRFKGLHRYLIGCGEHRMHMSNCMQKPKTSFIAKHRQRGPLSD